MYYENFKNEEVNSNEQISRSKIPEYSQSSKTVFQQIKRNLSNDVNPKMNFSSFVTVEMDEYAKKLMINESGKNFAVKDAYPNIIEISKEVISMTGELFNSQAPIHDAGFVTSGSSEAIMLGLLAHKWNWKNKRIKELKSTDKPNVVFGANVHTCWYKFAKYFDVEHRVIPLEDNMFKLNIEKVKDYVDENTIAVGAVAGSTFVGQVDDIKGLNSILEEIKEEKGLDIPIHVDAAIGGFIIPFVKPELEWDFRLSQVKSINVSNHKYGFVYSGMGTLLFKDIYTLPEQLQFKINYLSRDMDDFGLNFTKPSFQIVLQYYNFLKLGKIGYKNKMTSLLEMSNYLGDLIEETGQFEILNQRDLLPMVYFTTKKECKVSLTEISDYLYENQVLLPVYTLPPNGEKTEVIRIVIRDDCDKNKLRFVFDRIMDII